LPCLYDLLCTLAMTDLTCTKSYYTLLHVQISMGSIHSPEKFF